MKPSDTEYNFVKKFLLKYWSLALAFAVLLVALIESVCAFQSYRDLIDSDDWESLAEVLPKNLARDQAVVFGQSWLEERARMYLPILRNPDLVGRADLANYKELWIVWLEEPNDPFPGSIAAEFESEGQPQNSLKEIERKTAGDFVVVHYEQARALQLTDSLIQHIESNATTTQLRLEDKSCRQQKNAAHWSCARNEKIELRFAEIDYRPRRCLAFAVGDNKTASLKMSNFQMGDSLRGHLGFDGFDPRRRNDAPAELSIYADNKELARLVISDDQGWRPFQVETTAGQTELEIRLQVSAMGQWQRGRYNPRPVHVPCLELRSLGKAEHKTKESEGP